MAFRGIEGLKDIVIEPENLSLEECAVLLHKSVLGHLLKNETRCA